MPCQPKESVTAPGRENREEKGRGRTVEI